MFNSSLRHMIISPNIPLKIINLFIGHRIIAFIGRSNIQILSLFIIFYKYSVVIASVKCSYK
jgi:hypothetical protein